jgi:quinol monooxygenase YgiN
MPDSLVVVIGTIRLPPKNIEIAREIMRSMIDASRNEAGCLLYSYAEDVLDQGLIRVAEIWRDQASFDAHLDSPHIREWRAHWAELGIVERQLTAFRGTEGRPV